MILYLLDRQLARGTTRIEDVRLQGFPVRVVTCQTPKQLAMAVRIRYGEGIPAFGALGQVGTLPPRRRAVA